MSGRRSFLSRKPPFSSLSRAASAAVEIDAGIDEEEDGEEDRWSRMLPEIMRDIIGRVESAEEHWSLRKDVVACACVCRRWREVSQEIVRPLEESGNITFPSSLKQSGPRDLPMRCLIERNKKTSTFYLYLSLNQTFMDKGKFLLAAQKSRHGAYIEYAMSLDPNDLSQGSNAYMGKLRSDFLGTNFTLYDSQPPYNGAKASSNRTSRRFASKQISPHVPSGNFVVGDVSYKFNILKSKGPRRMRCRLQYTLPKEAIEGASLKIPSTHITSSGNRLVVLKNKAPQWHENLQCWCLNFHGRVTIASVKNFQLVATADPSPPHEGLLDEDTVLLQFGKVEDDLFTMDYRRPLSAFQAFAICLTSFGTKLACE